MTDYPDTPEGARALLNDLRQNCRVDGYGPDAAKLIPDPYVKGCWLATWPDGAQTLVYTQPHPAAPDFEEVD
jgi:hypothetical protein